MKEHTSVQSTDSKKTILSYPATPTWPSICATMQNQLDLISSCSAQQRRRQRRTASGTSKLHDMNLVRTFATTCVFVHAILGDDTTSRLYSHGKALSLKRITSSSFFRDKAHPAPDAVPYSCGVDM